jgi:predicted TIM-barrel fold metal-dependent hydrolase
MERLTIVSLDGHASPPPDIWPDYLEKRYHEFLPALIEENAWYTAIMRGLLGRTHAAERLDVFDFDGAVRNGGTSGLWNRDIRIAEMDREGIAAEVITSGDGRICGLFFESSNQIYPLDVCQAGVKAYHRWLADEFGKDKDRLILLGIVGCAPWRNMDEILAEVDWLADQGYAATNMPGFTTYLHQPPLFDPYWDPFWAKIEERGLMLWMHAGYGEQQGEFGRDLARLYRGLKAKGENLDDLVGKVNSEVFDDGAVFASVKPRRAMWQLMMGGVFDRFPKLKLVIAEVYADWMPATLKFLDETYETHRDALPAKRKPSEYWAQNCMNGMSFVRKCEVAQRHDVGIETLAFGRDYPHTEGTWPNTKLWLREAFDGVPVDEIKAIVGQNAIRFMGLDGARLAQIAERINAPTIAEITGPVRASPALIAHWDQRARFLAETEGASRVPEMSGMMREDLWRFGGSAV